MQQVLMIHKVTSLSLCKIINLLHRHIWCACQFRSMWDMHERMNKHHTALPASLCACAFIFFIKLPLLFRFVYSSFVLFLSEACRCKSTKANINWPPCSTGMTIGVCTYCVLWQICLSMNHVCVCAVNFVT